MSEQIAPAKNGGFNFVMQSFETGKYMFPEGHRISFSARKKYLKKIDVSHPI